MIFGLNQGETVQQLVKVGPPLTVHYEVAGDGAGPRADGLHIPRQSASFHIIFDDSEGADCFPFEHRGFHKLL